MICEVRPNEALLGQGDIFDEYPLIYWTSERDQSGTLKFLAAWSIERVVVLTQACDLANAKTAKVQVAVVHATAKLVSAGILKAQTIRDQVRRHLVFGWYFLPAGDGNPESIVDLHDIHTVPRELLDSKSGLGIENRPSRRRSASILRSTLRRPIRASRCPSPTKRCRNRRQCGCSRHHCRGDCDHPCRHHANCRRKTAMIKPVRQELLNALSELSAAMPDVRFGQLIANLSTLARGLSAEGLWDVEDEELLAAAREQLAYFTEDAAKPE